MSEQGKVVCPVCRRPFKERKDGNLRWHLGTVRDWAGYLSLCRGVGKPPVVPGRSES